MADRVKRTTGLNHHSICIEASWSPLIHVYVTSALHITDAANFACQALPDVQIIVMLSFELHVLLLEHFLNFIEQFFLLGFQLAFIVTVLVFLL